MVTATNGSVFTFGRNGNGQLGDGTTTQRTSPVLISVSIPNVIQIIGGDLFSAIFTSDKKLYTFGLNNVRYYFLNNKFNSVDN